MINVSPEPMTMINRDMTLTTNVVPSPTELPPNYPPTA